MFSTFIYFLIIATVRIYAVKEDLFDASVCEVNCDGLKKDCKNKNYDFVINYLQKFGYLNISNPPIDLVNINSTFVKDALYLFQETYNLTTDGKINNATLTLMKIPRCGLKDNIFPFKLHSEKWHKKVIKYHFAFATRQINELTKQAFSIWEKNADLDFVNDRFQPDILLSFKRDVHRFQKSSNFCPYPLGGGVLGHAYFPHFDQSTREIHLDGDENWCLEKNNTKCGSQNISLLNVLIHEIGHSLGISHSNDVNSIMYPYYRKDWIDLGRDDILAIQSLYGKRRKTTTTTTTTSTTARPSISSTEKVAVKDNIAPNFCDLKNLKTFLVINQKLYIFYEKWFWSVNLSDKSVGKAQRITDWLPFLSKNFTRVDFLYQRPSGEIVFFTEQYIFMIEFPSLKLVNGYPKYISILGGGTNLKIHGVVNSCRGRTYVFFNDVYFMEIDECRFNIKSYGQITKTFPFLPASMESVFRYTNGLLYFFKNNSIVQYNEFTNFIVGMKENNLDVFGIACVNVYANNTIILNKLKKLVLQLS